MAFKQQGRVCTVTTPLGEDVLLVQRFHGSEFLSKPFQFDVDLLSEKDAIDFKSIVGKGICVHVELESGAQRHFHGIVSRFGQGVSDGRFVSYRAMMVPWLWLLTRNADSRIFQDKTATDIIKEIFDERGCTDYEIQTEGSFKTRTYCVQYRETDFNFVTRLMEEEGISYWFRHEEGRHVLVLANSKSGWPKCEGQPEADYSTAEGADRMAGEVEEWLAEREMHPGKYAVSDWNFETPSDSLLAQTQTTEVIGGNTRWEIFDYPTEHEDTGEGDGLVRLRMEIEEAGAVRMVARSTCAPFCPGSRFTLNRHYRGDCNGEYLITSVQHSVAQGVGYDAEGGGTYANSFSCIPASIPFRSPLTTPKPVVQGVQTAIVCGKSGEEIDVDKYGRVKVQFHWDRRGKRDDKSSCWIRVAQLFAGKTFGAAFWPRVGQEVVVSFLEGDPDRPLITGRVYNAQQMPPYELPANATQSGIKSRSSKGGAATNFNELRFEDKKGSEHVFLHAEKDFHQHVKDGSFAHVGGEQHLTVKKDDYSLYEMNRHREVKMDVIEKIGSEHHTTIAMSRHTKVGTDDALEAGMAIHLKAGMNVVIEAGVQLTLKGGGGFVTIDPSGVTIQGTLVRINSGGAAGSGKGAKAKSPKPAKEAKKQ